jgi:cytochrome oxidase assembly protein ShyY1
VRSTAKWIGFHLLCLAAVVAMVFLGLWQLRRLDEKRTFNEAVRAVAEAPIVDYVPGGAQPAYQRVRATGEYLDREFIVVNVSQGGSGGRDQVAALALDDGSLLLVNRGFSAGNTPLPALPEGRVEVMGRVRESMTPRRGQTADDGTQQLTQIRRVDLDALALQFDVPLQSVFVDALEEDGAAVDGLVPIAFPALDEGSHFSYAVQWFLFSGFVVLGWVLAVRRSRQPTSGSRRKKALIPEQYL